MISKLPWIVVVRKLRNHSTERGIVTARCITQAQAEGIKRELLSRESMKSYNVWATPTDSYDEVQRKLDDAQRAVTALHKFLSDIEGA